METGRSSDTPGGIGGWLLVLCALLLIAQPVSLAVTASPALRSLPLRGTGLAVILVARLLAAAFGIAAGLALSGRHTGAVGMAKASLGVSAAVDVLVYTTPYFPNNRPPGDTTIILIASLAFYAIWLVYLSRSKRVRATFSD